MEARGTMSEPWKIDGRVVRCGDRVRRRIWRENDALLVVAIDGLFFWGRDKENFYWTGDARLDWHFAPEPPKSKKRLAPALWRHDEKNPWMLSDQLYASEKEAKYERAGSGDVEVIWPAIPTQDGFYEVPEDE